MDALDPLLLVGAFETDGAFETAGAPLGTAETEGAALGLALGMHVGPSALLHLADLKMLLFFVLPLRSRPYRDDKCAWHHLTFFSA